MRSSHQWVGHLSAANGSVCSPVFPASVNGSVTPPRTWDSTSIGSRRQSIRPTLVDKAGITAVVGSMFYITRDTNELSVRTSLLNWAGRRGLTETALGAMLGHASAYSDDGPGADDRQSHEPIRLPLVLSSSQEQVVRTARRVPVTVVSGAPGTGKTHTLCAVAVDNVARGGSVLIATSSRAATDAVVELLTRTPGPDPVRFGDGAGMSRLLDDLEQRRANPLSMARIAELDAAVSAAAAKEEAIRRSIVGRARRRSQCGLGRCLGRGPAGVDGRCSGPVRARAPTTPGSHSISTPPALRSPGGGHDEPSDARSDVSGRPRVPRTRSMSSRSSWR